MNFVIKWLLEKMVSKYALGYLLNIHAKLIGNRTQLLGVLLGLVWALEALQIIPSEAARKLEMIIGAMMVPTALDKFTRYAPLKDAILEQLKKKLERAQETTN